MTESPSVRRRVVLLSAYHDYRTAKRASIHHIADGLVRACFDVSFVSTRLSWLSKLTDDSRLFLWKRANRIEEVNGVRCYLWKTLLHPFQHKRGWLNGVMARLYPAYAELPNRTFDRMIADADFILIESSVAAIYLRRLRRLNPTAKIIYYATDRLDTVGAHPYVIGRLEADAQLIDHFSLRSPQMASSFPWGRDRLFHAPFGIDLQDCADVETSPYDSSKRVAVSVGSMLFDPGFFEIAGAAFPDVEFHVIGCGTCFVAPENVHLHAEMPFVETLPFMKHATIGIAAYRVAPECEYLSDSSLKLAQYEYFALPAVCPDFAVGHAHYRFGYIPDDPASIRQAVGCALAASGSVLPRAFLTWEDVARRVIEPHLYADATI